MTKRLLTLMTLLTTVSLFAQDIPWKYRALYIGGGPRTLTAEAGTIEFDFVDNSPSMDMINTTTLVEDSYNSFGFQFGFMWGRYKGISYDLNLDISKNSIFEFSVGYSHSLEMGSNMLTIRPAINGGLASFGFDLGDLENEAGYIQIGETQFYGEYLDTRLNSSGALWGPRLDVIANIGEKLGVFVKLNYDLASEGGELDINFTDPSSGEDKVSFSSISLTDSTVNPDVKFNGEKLTNLPYDTSGLRFTIGIAYVWKKDRS